MIVILKGFGVFAQIDQKIENKIQRGVSHEKPEKTIWISPKYPNYSHKKNVENGSFPPK